MEFADSLDVIINETLPALQKVQKLVLSATIVCHRFQAMGFGEHAILSPQFGLVTISLYLSILIKYIWLQDSLLANVFFSL